MKIETQISKSLAVTAAILAGLTLQGCGKDETPAPTPSPDSKEPATPPTPPAGGEIKTVKTPGAEGVKPIQDHEDDTITNLRRMAIDERNLRTTHINNIIKRHRDTDDLNDEQVKAFEDTLEMMGVYDSQIDEVCDPKMTSTPADVKKAITEVTRQEENFLKSVNFLGNPKTHGVQFRHLFEKIRAKKYHFYNTAAEVERHVASMDPSSNPGVIGSGTHVTNVSPDGKHVLRLEQMPEHTHKHMQSSDYQPHQQVNQMHEDVHNELVGQGMKRVGGDSETITTQEQNKGITSHVATKEDRYKDPTNGNTVHVTTQAAKFDKDAPVKGGWTSKKQEVFDKNGKSIGSVTVKTGSSIGMISSMAGAGPGEAGPTRVVGDAGAQFPKMSMPQFGFIEVGHHGQDTQPTNPLLIDTQPAQPVADPLLIDNLLASALPETQSSPSSTLEDANSHENIQPGPPAVNERRSVDTLLQDVNAHNFLQKVGDDLGFDLAGYGQPSSAATQVGVHPVETESTMQTGQTPSPAPVQRQLNIGLHDAQEHSRVMPDHLI